MISSEREAKQLGSSEEPGAHFVGYRWSRNLVQPALIIITMVSLYAAVILVIQSVSTSIPWPALVPIVAFIALEAVSTTIWLEHPDRNLTDHNVYRIAEFLFIVLIVRVVTWGIAGNENWPQLHLIRNYLRSPLLLIDDPFFWVTLLLLGIVWLHTLSTTHTFAQLAIDRAEAAYFAMPAATRKSENRPLPVDRGQLVERYFQRWIGGAVAMVFCIALASIDLSDVAASAGLRSIGRAALPQGALTALVAYVIAGLMLLSHARLAAMNARWLIGGSIKGRRVERSWHRSSLWLLLMVAAVAAVLPLGSTPAARPILSFLLQALVNLFGLVAGIFFGLLSLIFPKSAGSTAGTSSPAGPIAPPQLPPAGQPNDTLALILSSLFWAVAIFVTVTAVFFFLRDRVRPVDTSRIRSLLRSFLGWIKSFLDDTRVQVTAVREGILNLIREKGPTLGDVGKRRLGYIRFNDLSPRQQLRYIYLSTVRRAEKRGVERHPSETPLEYAQELKDQWPETGEDVDSLTNAFLKARYSPRAVEPEEVSLIRTQWKRLRSRLRRR